MKLRTAIRLVPVLLHLLKGLAICTLVFPFLTPAQRQQRVGRWSSRLLRIFDVSVTLARASCVPTDGLWVANHVSWIDVFVINALYPARFVAKSEVRAWPLIGALCAQAGTIFLARANRRDLQRTNALLVSRLRDGERIVVFPEGTSAAQGAMLPFRANLFEAAILAGVPVQPLALSYVDADGDMHRAVEYIGTTTLFESMVAMLSGRHIYAQLQVLPAVGEMEKDRRALAQRAGDDVRAALATSFDKQRSVSS